MNFGNNQLPHKTHGFGADLNTGSVASVGFEPVRIPAHSVNKNIINMHVHTGLSVIDRWLPCGIQHFNKDFKPTAINQFEDEPIPWGCTFFPMVNVHCAKIDLRSLKKLKIPHGPI